MKKVLLALALIVFCSPVYAKEKNTMGSFLDMYDKGNSETKKIFHKNLRAMEQGMGWSNTELRANKRKPIYCPPSKLNITGTYCPKILLPDYGNIEIKLTPLEKTLFLLYLNHPEGIAYHDLVDCKTEIREIYSKLANTGDQAEIEERIEALINPLEGSAKEKISKIKQKFTNKLGAELAANYIIQGPRGDKKEITLDREFVVYQ